MKSSFFADDIFLITPWPTAQQKVIDICYVQGTKLCTISSFNTFELLLESDLDEIFNYLS